MKKQKWYREKKFTLLDMMVIWVLGDVIAKIITPLVERLLNL